MTDDKALESREGFAADYRSPLVRAVHELRQRFGRVGLVVIDFTADRYGVCTSGATPEFEAHMSRLGGQLLAAIDDGQFDPEDSHGR